MRSNGMKISDPVGETGQVEWLIVPTAECPDAMAEGQIIRRHFRRPHEAWPPAQAFVEPVVVRRSQRRVLFRQRSGLQG